MEHGQGAKIRCKVVVGVTNQMVAKKPNIPNDFEFKGLAID